MKQQKVLGASGNYGELDAYLERNRLGKVFLVCGSSIAFLDIDRYFRALDGRAGTDVVRFTDFRPNPCYESVVKGVELFHREKCDCIIAVGGGSAMDVAKCVKLYSGMDPSANYLEQPIVPNDIKFIAVPTTAGSGSEATRYAVIYYQGEKQSVTHESCIPDAVLMDGSVLKTLPDYQKKSAMMDALCHGLESYWSVNSTEESRGYSMQAIRQILSGMEGYLANEDGANEAMLMAANMAGRAINISQTTAGHAMCYKLTGMYGIAHGHAAALCDSVLFPWMIRNVDRCTDPRGKGHLEGIFREIADAMGCGSAEEAAGKLRDMTVGLGLSAPVARAEDYKILRRSVNPVRLKNHPVSLDEETMDRLYHRILDGEK